MIGHSAKYATPLSVLSPQNIIIFVVVIFIVVILSVVIRNRTWNKTWLSYSHLFIQHNHNLPQFVLQSFTHVWMSIFVCGAQFDKIYMMSSHMVASASLLAPWIAPRPPSPPSFFLGCLFCLLLDLPLLLLHLLDPAHVPPLVHRLLLRRVIKLSLARCPSCSHAAHLNVHNWDWNLPKIRRYLSFSALNQSINQSMGMLSTHPLEYVNSDANAHHLVAKSNEWFLFPCYH